MAVHVLAIRPHIQQRAPEYYQDSLNGLQKSANTFEERFISVPNIKFVCPSRPRLIDQGKISLYVRSSRLNGKEGGLPRQYHQD